MRTEFVGETREKHMLEKHVTPSACTSTGTHPRHLSGAGKNTCTLRAKPYASSCKPPHRRPGTAPLPASRVQPPPSVHSSAPFAQCYLPHRPWNDRYEQTSRRHPYRTPTGRTLLYHIAPPPSRYKSPKSPQKNLAKASSLRKVTREPQKPQNTSATWMMARSTPSS